MVHRSVQYCHETISHPVFQQEVLKIPDPGGFISCDQMICECHLSPHVAPPGVRVEYGDKTHSSSQFVPLRRWMTWRFHADIIGIPQWSARERAEQS